jgi:hypothetical protein
MFFLSVRVCLMLEVAQPHAGVCSHCQGWTHNVQLCGLLSDRNISLRLCYVLSCVWEVSVQESPFPMCSIVANSFSMCLIDHEFSCF